MKQQIIFSVITVFTLVYDGGDFSTAVRDAVIRQTKTYPNSTLQDLYKLFFQDRYGPGHIIDDTAAARRYLLDELNSYSTVTGEAAEPTGWQHNFYRVNLSVIKNGFIPYDRFFDAFVRSTDKIEPVPIEKWKTEWSDIEKIIKSMELPFPDYDRDCREIEKRLQQGIYAVHHSEIYNETYTPHYRIISRKIFEEEILPLLKNHQTGIEVKN